MKSIYVGNLPFSATEDDVREMFAPYGEVAVVKLVMDRETGRPRGFGFVEMDDEAADAAIKALDGQDGAVVDDTAFPHLLVGGL
ncbi:MAG: RNA-binding protein [Acidobacteria bacterium]|nr:RNA-binding protein [Acidobacteriota bacterium]